MNTGGPAFPIHGTGMFHEPITNTQGMTLLDWMAGQALEKASKGSEKTAEDIAKRAYYIASAMLSEKARREADHPEDKLGKDHSPDSGKMAALEAANRELVEALESCEAAFSKFAPQEESAYGMAWIKVRATLAKAKGVA